MKTNEYLKIILVAILGMLVLASLLGFMDIIIGSFELRIALSFFDYGFTELSIPPLGRVRAQTHVPPLKLTLLLKNINIDLLREDLERLPEQDLVDSIVGEARASLAVYALKLLFLGFLGGATGVYLLLSRKPARVLLGGASGLLVLALLLISLYGSYDTQAFLTPEFEGALAAAPWAFGLLEETLAKVATLGEQLEVIAGNLYILFEKLEFLEPLGLVDGERKILHASDIHNNPAPFHFIEQVVRRFNVDFVVDTGDITDFGTPLEAELAGKIGDLGVPYILVPGNHDSPEIIRVLRELPGVDVLELGVVEVLDVRVAGIQDPASLRVEMTVPPDVVLDDYAEELRSFLEEGRVVPDLVAAHHPRIVSAFIGEVPLLLTGHTHSLDISQVGGSVIINAGTTGAAGIRGLQTAREVPFSLVLLHLNRSGQGWKLIAADTIKVFHFQSGFSLSRTLFPGGGLEGDGPPGVE